MIRSLTLVFTALMGASLASPQTTLYVNDDLQTGAGDGSSWEDAYRGPLGLRDALAVASPSTRVFVTGGTYVPGLPGDRTQTFSVGNGVAIYGGFLGTESHPGERPPVGSVATILSGDLAGDDGNGGSNAENAIHVVTIQSTSTPARLDGVVIARGNASATTLSHERGGGVYAVSRPVEIHGCRFVANRAEQTGGAIYSALSTLVVHDCTFENNSAGFRGGAIDVVSEALVDRCMFRNNSAESGGAIRIGTTATKRIANSLFVDNVANSQGFGDGGAILAELGTGTDVIGCTFTRNRAPNGIGGALHRFNGVLRVENSILWANESEWPDHDVRSQIGSSITPNYCVLQAAGNVGTGNVDADPQFVSPATGDFTLASGSPAIDAGNSAATVGTSESDLERRRRRVDDPAVADTGIGPGAAVDLGAYERSELIGTVFCAPGPNTTGRTGRIDATGSVAVSANDLTLVAADLPTNAFGFFLVAPWTAEGSMPPGSTGRLCLAGSIGRFVGPGQVLDSGAGGTFALAIDLLQLPQPTTSVAAQPGSTWAFQAWHRDSVAGIPVSNFTDGVRIRFE